MLGGKNRFWSEPADLRGAARRTNGVYGGMCGGVRESGVGGGGEVRGRAPDQAYMDGAADGAADEACVDEAYMDESYMEQALAEAGRAFALGETPIGAIVVDASGSVIGRGCNMRETWRDPTAHAEVIALRDAARVIGDWRLYGCRLYVTVEPCLMCAGAIVASRISTVVFGAGNPKGGAFGSSFDVQDFTGLNHYPCVKTGVLEDKCAMMVKDFFRAKRGG